LDDGDIDHISVDSSLSSIPLKDLKQHLANQKKQKKKAAKKTSSNRYNKKPILSAVVGPVVNGIQVAKPRTTSVSKSTKTALIARPLKSIQDETQLSASACCLCHCGLDCADRALFFENDRIQDLQDQANANDIDIDMDMEMHDKDKDSFNLDDPYFPLEVYDPHNALVYCDGCSRLYHQKCHFVPLFIIPRGNWFCLLCSSTTTTIATTTITSSTTTTPTRIKSKQSESTTSQPLLFQCPPNVSFKTLELEWEARTGPSEQARLWHKQLSQTLQFCKTQAANIRLANTQLHTLTSIRRNRQHFLATYNYGSASTASASRTTKKDSNPSSSTSQQLADTLFKITTSKWKLRTLLMSLERYQQHANLIVSENLLKWAAHTNTTPNNKVTEYLFPHGLQVHQEHGRRIPRTAEWKGNAKGSQAVGVDTTTTTPRSATTIVNASNPQTKKVPLEISIHQSPRGGNSSKTAKNVVVKNPTCTSSPKAHRSKQRRCATHPQAQLSSPKASKPTTYKPVDDCDEDSGISLDDLQCCICKTGEATDENDLVLCDREGCCRAFHMQCVWPRLSMEALEENDDDWFCPLCQALSNILSEIQEACMDEEWTYRRDAAKKAKKNINSTHRNKDNESRSTVDSGSCSSLLSWNCAADVFPESEWQMQASKQLRLGPQPQPQQEKAARDVSRLLGTYLGSDFIQPAAACDPIPTVGSDSEDENDYSLFDEASFEERKRRKRERKKNRHPGGEEDGDSRPSDGSDDDDNDDGDTLSSQATLQEMSSVEMHIDKNELAALSEGDEENSDDSFKSEEDSVASNGGRLRVSKRLRRSKSAVSHSIGQSSLGDAASSATLADFDTANIVEGKRRRTIVDYRKLNDALFGDLTAAERAKLDDKTDYQERSKAAKKTNKRHSNGKRRSTNKGTVKGKRHRLGSEKSQIKDDHDVDSGNEALFRSNIDTSQSSDDS
jgi:PHD-finger